MASSKNIIGVGGNGGTAISMSSSYSMTAKISIGGDQSDDTNNQRDQPQQRGLMDEREYLFVRVLDDYGEPRVILVHHEIVYSPHHTLVTVAEGSMVAHRSEVNDIAKLDISSKLYSKLEGTQTLIPSLIGEGNFYSPPKFAIYADYRGEDEFISTADPENSFIEEHLRKTENNKNVQRAIIKANDGRVQIIGDAEITNEHMHYKIVIDKQLPRLEKVLNVLDLLEARLEGVNLDGELTEEQQSLIKTRGEMLKLAESLNSHIKILEDTIEQGKFAIMDPEKREEYLAASFMTDSEKKNFTEQCDKLLYMTTAERKIYVTDLVGAVLGDREWAEHTINRSDTK